MPAIIETIVYQLDELDSRARDEARDWYREGALDHDWFETVYEDFERICAIMGITLAARTIRLFGGGMRTTPQIFFSGCSSQGDGACFKGTYGYVAAAAATIRAYAPDDAWLHAIADQLQLAQRRNFY